MRTDAGQLVSPIADRIAECFRLRQVACPMAIVEPGQPFMGIGLARQCRLVARAQLLEQQVERPAIENGVMHIEQNGAGAIFPAMDFSAPQRRIADTKHIRAHAVGTGVGCRAGGIDERYGRQLLFAGFDPEFIATLMDCDPEFRARFQQFPKYLA